MSRKGEYPKARHDSAGQCSCCGWPLDRFAQCTNPDQQADEDCWGLTDEEMEQE